MKWLSDLVGIVPMIVSLFTNKNKTPCVEVSENRNASKNLDVVLSHSLHCRKVGEETFLRGKTKIRNIGDVFYIKKIIVDDKVLISSVAMLFDEILELSFFQKDEDEGLIKINKVELEITNERNKTFLAVFYAEDTGLNYTFTFDCIKKKKLSREQK